MSTYRFANRFHRVSLAVAIVATVALSVTPARAGDCCSSRKSSGGHDHGARAAGSEHAGHQHSQIPAASVATVPLHGGQVHATNFHRFEVVYLPHETRIYLYGTDRRPLSPRGAEGQVTMQVRGNDQVYRYALKPVAATSGQRWEEFLVAPVDVSRIRDGDMMVSFYLSKLPTQQQPQASFSQTFALTRTRPSVTVAALTESDRAGIARQRVCPVSGGELASMGTPVKLLVADQPVYLCCQGCTGKVRENPERYVTGAPSIPQQPAQGVAGHELAVTKATAADEVAVRAQGTCPVLNTRLGSMGTPIKVTRGGRSLFLCCQGCVSKVEKNPDYYFAQATQMRTGG